VEAHLLAPLDPETRETFRAQVRLLATRADALDPLDGPCGRPREVDAELPSPRPHARPPFAVPILENSDA
jgi:hypothetical protein